MISVNKLWSVSTQQIIKQNKKPLISVTSFGMMKPQYHHDFSSDRRVEAFVVHKNFKAMLYLEASKTESNFEWPLCSSVCQSE